MRLPTRPPLQPGQALDCYLEHLAEANHLEPFDLLNVLQSTLSREELRYLTLAPSPTALRAISDLSGQDVGALHAATQAGYGPLAPADFSRLEPARPAASYRAIAATGWVMGHGTQACPDCLAAHGTWQTSWMLYASIGCTRHHRTLTATCPRCQRPLRDSRHSPLRPHGASTACQNPQDVRGQHCLHNLATITTPAMTTETSAYQHALDHVLAGHRPRLLGQPAQGATWLSEHRALASLICHITTHNPDRTQPWQTALLDEATRRTDVRGPRWGITPPASPWIRGHALAEAHSILTRPDPDSAAHALQAWILRIPSSTEALTTWTRDRLPTNHHVTALVNAAALVRRRPGRRITALALPELSAEQIPWIIPETLAARHLPALPGVTNRTRNAYAALCLARHLPDVTTWAQAAEALGLPGDSGIRTARLCSAAMRTHHDTFTHGLATLARQLANTSPGSRP
ncbi:TniQ protein [Luteococcus japonicus]|uniref:TniQ protein n=1 Tax=Luteococcus japonicus TaxID=33984 RepID=A0A3N1ZW91_9ACTN|nr:TniQ family protein [Luteococcus japonicus]ROR55120.1 TniQ protein [Luteococcus japonicus]